jgi:anti-anti-sigma factor
MAHDCEPRYSDGPSGSCKAYYNARRAALVAASPRQATCYNNATSVDPTGRNTRELTMKIETRKVYDVLVVDMSGRLDSVSSGDAGDRIVSIAQGEDKRVLLNLDKLDYVSSAGLRVILRGAKLLQGNRGELKICNAKGGARTVLETSGFDSLIKIYDTEKEAFSAFVA